MIVLRYNKNPTYACTNANIEELKLKKNIFILYCVSLALFSMQKKTDIAIIGLTLTFIAISMIVGERLMDKK